MGNEESVETQGIDLTQHDLKPLVDEKEKKKYKLLSILGTGAFGRVFKVQETSTKEVYAMKCVSYETKDVTKKQQEKILKSAKTEIKLLSKLDSPSIVKLISHFTIPFNPMDKNIKIKHLCVIIEFVRGSDLNVILKKIEFDPEKEESEDQVTIPSDLTVYWFIKLLETLEHIHSKSIIHRDLKPDNILCSYKSLSDRKQMALKISDFGVGVVMKTGKKVHEIAGQLFYSAPEVLSQDPEGYDQKIDVWSLGIIFMQVYAQISINTYQDAVNEIFQSIKDSTKKNHKFCKRFSVRSMKTVSILRLLIFFHENNLFKKIVKMFIDDPGVEAVLNHMLVERKKRLTSQELLELNIIKTWKFILNLRSELMQDDFNVLGVITFLKVLRDPFLFDRCIDLLKEHISLGTECEKFVENNGIQMLFRRIHKMKDLFKKKYLPFIITILMKIIVHYKVELKMGMIIYKSILRVVSVSLRKFGCSKILKDLVLSQSGNKYYYFIHLLGSSCRSFQREFLDYNFLEILVDKIVEGNKQDENLVFHRTLVDTFSQSFSLEEARMILKKLKKKGRVNYYPFLKKFRFKNRIAEEVLPFVFKGVEKGKLLDEWVNFLSFFLIDFEKSELKSKEVSTKKYSLVSEKPASKLKMKIIQQSQKNLVTKKKGVFVCNYDDSKKYVEMISNERLVTSKKEMNEMEKSTSIIGYYEIIILGGGSKDDILFGVISPKKQVLYQARSGKINLLNLTTNENSQKKSKRFFASSGDVIGCGITKSGNIVFTHNGIILEDSLVFFDESDIDVKKQKKGIKAFVKMNGNSNMKIQFNFGKFKFSYDFKGGVEFKQMLNENVPINSRVSKNKIIGEKKKSIYIYTQVANIFLQLNKEQRIFQKIKQLKKKDKKLCKKCTFLENLVYLKELSNKDMKMFSKLSELYFKESRDAIKSEKIFLEKYVKKKIRQLSVKERLSTKYYYIQKKQEEEGIIA